MKIKYGINMNTLKNPMVLLLRFLHIYKKCAGDKPKMTYRGA